MADIDTPTAVSLGLAVLAGVVAAIEKTSKVRRDWLLRPMADRKPTSDAPPSEPQEAAPVTRRGRASLQTLSEQVPITRAEFEARVDAICEDVSELKAAVGKLDDWRDRFEGEMLRGVGGINTRLETLRGRISGLHEMVRRRR